MVDAKTPSIGTYRERQEVSFEAWRLSRIVSWHGSILRPEACRNAVRDAISKRLVNVAVSRLVRDTSTPDGGNLWRMNMPRSLSGN